MQARPSSLLLSGLLLLLALTALGGCVTREEYDLAVADGLRRIQATQAAAAQDRARLQAAMQAQIDKLEARVKALNDEIAKKDDELSQARAEAGGLQAKLDESTAINEQLTAELQRMGKNVEKLLAERGTLADALERSKDRLEELRKAQEAAQKRAELFHSLLKRLKSMVDGGDLDVVLRDGRMVLRLRNDVLFDSGSVEIKPAGRDALKQLAKVLATLPDRNFQVAGHTDNVPIATARFPSNWELSTARAVSVVRFLMSEGMKAEVLSAAGYGEHDPVAANDKPESRAKNRRIEIVLQPNIAELVSVPEGP